MQFERDRKKLRHDLARLELRPPGVAEVELSTGNLGNLSPQAPQDAPTAYTALISGESNTRHTSLLVGPPLWFECHEGQNSEGVSL
jgi:hypothetical protein